VPPEDPLPTLLSRALTAFTIEFDNLAEERIAAAGSRPWIASQAMWANHLRFVGDDGIAARDLMHRSLVSRSTMRTRLGALRRWRYVTLDAADVVRLTDAGRRSRDVWRPLAAEVEARWAVRHGDAAIDALRAALAPAAAADAPLPRHLPIVGGAMFTEVVTPPEPVPDEAGEPDLSVLLARALLVYTLAFESETKLSLPIHVDGLQVLDADGTRVRDLPRRSGCSKEGMAMITGYLARIGLAVVAPDPDADRGKVVRLNARGMSARERGVARVARIEDDLRARLGRTALARLRRSLDAVIDSPAFAEGMEPPPTGWRDRPPYAAQTDRLLTDPRAALPRHPLMLHRGGFPDGA
jgi:hypothetical protein